MKHDAYALERAMSVASCHVEDKYDDEMNYAPQGKCITCERPWPCEMVVLAETLAARTPDAQAVTEAEVVALARLLCKEHAETCNVDEGDAWMVYGNSFRESATQYLSAALAARGGAPPDSMTVEHPYSNGVEDGIDEDEIR